MRYMIVERFKPGCAKAIYSRFRDRGRMLPQGLGIVDSWVSCQLNTCFQLMECEDESLFQEWIEHWRDLADFEIIPVISSREASQMVLEENDSGCG